MTLKHAALGVAGIFAVSMLAALTTLAAFYYIAQEDRDIDH